MHGAHTRSMQATYFILFYYIWCGVCDVLVLRELYGSYFPLNELNEYMDKSSRSHRRRVSNCFFSLDENRVGFFFRITIPTVKCVFTSRCSMQERSPHQISVARSWNRCHRSYEPHRWWECIFRIFIVLLRRRRRRRHCSFASAIFVEI